MFGCKGSSVLANHSAVAILVSTTTPPSLLMVQRATRPGDPWSGDMAFPGGRKEKQDKNHIDTARRELEEEVGIILDATPVGKLSILWTKSHNTLRPMAVHPYVFEAPAVFEAPTVVKTPTVVEIPTVVEKPTIAETPTTAFARQETEIDNLSTTHLTLSHEVAAALWIPLSVFRPANRQHFIWRTRLGKFRMACYHYQHYKIWGLSLKMIENLIAHPVFSGLISTEAGQHPIDKI